MSSKSISKVATGAGIILMGIFISKILGYLYRLIVARIGPEQYGLLSIALAVATLLANLALFGLGSGVLRYVSFYNGEETKVKGAIISAIKMSSIFSIFLAIALFILSPYIAANIFKAQELTFFFRILAIIIPLIVIRDILLNAIKAFQKIKYEVYAKNIAENLSKVFFTILFLSMGLGLLGAVFGYAAAMILSSVLVFYYIQKKVFPIFSSVSSMSLKKELLSYSWPLLISSQIFQLILWTDTIFIGYFTNATETGIYNAALPTAQLLFILPYALTALLIPILSELKTEREKEFQATYKIVTKWILLTNIVPFTLLIIYSEEIISILFGDQYIRATVPLIILSVGYLLNYITLTSMNVLMLFKKTKTLFKISLIGLIISILLNLTLIPLYGINGAAISTAVAYIIMGILIFILSYNLTKINTLDKNYFKIIFSIIIAAIITKTTLSFLLLNPFAKVIMGSISLLGIYILVLIITRAFSTDEKKLFEEIKGKVGM